MKLFNNCILTKGPSRSLIIDPQRESYYWIENENIDQLTDNKIEDVDFEAFLKKNELAHDNESYFPTINFDYFSSENVNNVIIDYCNTSDYDILNAIDLLCKLKVKHFQFRFFSELKIDFHDKIIKRLMACDECESMELIIKYSNEIEEDWLTTIVYENIKVKTIIVHSYHKDYVFHNYQSNTRYGMGNVYFTKQIVNDESHCGYISPQYFSFSNIKSISETFSRNSCLNQKLGIDKTGSIKNCPSMKDQYGKISETSLNGLRNLVETKSFKEKWYMSKADIDVCKDCEFRLICSDCRAYTVDNEINGKPKKCNYDPFKK